MVCFVSLQHTFWDLLFCLTGKLLWFNLSIASLCNRQVHWFISSILIYSYSYLIFMNLETWMVHRIFKRNLNFFKNQPSLNQHEKYQADWTNLSWDTAVSKFWNLICHEHLWPNSIKKLLLPFLNMPYKTFTNHLLFFFFKSIPTCQKSNWFPYAYLKYNWINNFEIQLADSIFCPT